MEAAAHAPRPPSLAPAPEAQVLRAPRRAGCRAAPRRPGLQILGGLPKGPVTAFPSLAKYYPSLAIWLTVWAVKIGRMRRRLRRSLSWKRDENSEVPDFDLNVLPPVLPKRDEQGESTPTRKVWRKTVYWAKRHDRARYGTDDRFRAIQDTSAGERVVVLGAGAFGTAMATLLARKGYPVCVVARDPLVSRFINRKHVNPRYLSDYDLPAELAATTDAAEALPGCTVAVHAMPVQASRKALEGMRDSLPRGIPIVCVSKGVEMGTRELMCDVIPHALARDDRENPVVAVSGPSFAREIMDRRPTSVVAASRDQAAALRVQRLLTSHYFRVSTTDDIVGVEVAGALKNVLAIAAGICEGLGLGLNAKAALVTQGTAEIRWLATAMGARPETLGGLAGMGDILLTCFGSLSRNQRVGVRLGRGEQLEGILTGSDGVAEGVYTARLVVELADKYRVLMPVLTAVARILNNEVSPRQAVFQVMSLPPLPESA
uniref:Glycerol-3-phosphate dehydrogenase [NAD(+)] n=1 Tax=Alexandrium monilatum TaxID=311494 RepID=A0A7S4SF68_9DINO